MSFEKVCVNFEIYEITMKMIFDIEHKTSGPVDLKLWEFVLTQNIPKTLQTLT